MRYALPYIDQITVIAAMGKNRVIGNKGKLPWNHKSGDLGFFHKETEHNIVIMGRKTFDSIGGLLRNRHNIIISNTMDGYEAFASLFSPMIRASATAWVSRSLDKAISEVIALKRMSKYVANDSGRDGSFAQKRVYIIGGQEIYEQALESYATNVLLTHMNRDFEGDTFFPDISSDWDVWAILDNPKGSRSLGTENGEACFVDNVISYVRKRTKP